MESLRVSEQLGGRPLVKAWNAITTGSSTHLAMPAGATGLIAILVAADDETQRALGLCLVPQTGVRSFDAGTLADSWRQQPGTPACCTDLTRDELADALAGPSPPAHPSAVTSPWPSSPSSERTRPPTAGTTSSSRSTG